MISIGIDCRFARFHAGLGRYTRALVSELIKRNDNIRYTLFVHSCEEKWIADLQPCPRIIEAPFKHYSFAEQVRFPAVIHNAKVDLFFSPHFNVPLKLKVPFIVTIHDLILHRYPNQASFSKRMAYRFLMKHAVRKSSAIIAVSNFTKSDLVSAYGAGITSKITRIYEGVEKHFAPKPQAEQDRVRSLYGLHKPFFLYVGNGKEHKRVPMLISAFAKANVEHADLILVSGGKEVSLIQRPENVQILSDVPDDDLPALYSAANAFVTASAYEGFGLPALEAQACGCKVIACNTSALPEICKQNSTLVKDSVSALSIALSEALPGKIAPAPLSFNWEKAAEETAAMFLQVL